MRENKELYEFILDHSSQLTEEWYRLLDKSNSSTVYGSSNPAVIEKLKQQNNAFHLKFCKVFIEPSAQFYQELEEWVLAIAKDDEHLRTPLHFVLREFFNNQELYLDAIKKFVHLHKGKYTEEVIESWERTIIKGFNQIISWFTKEYHKYAESKLLAQKEMIIELSSPVISLNKDVALLPLVGDIDTGRAKFILENTLEQCANKGVNCLLLDLSGVVMIDTMVAQQIFQVIEALNLIGVKCTISGIRPEIAQTAIQLGISFEKISIVSNLGQAVNLYIR